MVKHWSREFYAEAKAEGYKFAIRQHIPNFVSGVEASLHKLKNKKEMWQLPFVKRWKENEIYQNCNLPADHPEAVKELKLKKYDCTDDGEQLLMAYCNNGSYWVVAYAMDLEKFKPEEE